MPCPECDSAQKKVQQLERQIRLLEQSRTQEVKLREMLNQTMSRLQEREKELKDLNERLETKVTERTQELSEAIEQLTQIASTDHLTKVNNRMKFTILAKQKIAEVQRTSTPLALLFIDLDHFKMVNDRYGHDCGDSVLRQFASAITTIIRGSDIFARWGGEEFVLLMDNCPFSVAQERAEMIRNRIQEYTFDGVGHLTCSMGLTLLRPSDDIHTFLKRADEAMYQAKTHGRYQVCVS